MSLLRVGKWLLLTMGILTGKAAKAHRVVFPSYAEKGKKLRIQGCASSMRSFFSFSA